MQPHLESLQLLQLQQFGFRQHPPTIHQPMGSTHDACDASKSEEIVTGFCWIFQRLSVECAIVFV